MSRRAAQVAAVATLLALSTPTAARTYTVEDLLRTEDFGEVSFDPGERWLVFERLEPFLAMSRFDMLPRAGVLRSRLYRVDLHAPWRAVPLLADPQPGTIIYGFSVNGSRLAIGRLSGERWQLGIVTMRTGAVRWLDLSPEYNPSSTTLRWISDEQLVGIVNPDGERPWWLRTDSLPADRLPGRWAATRSGSSAAVTALGSGRFQDVGDRASENRLMLVDAVSGQATHLATGHFLSMEVAPSREHIALIERGPTAPLPRGRSVSQIDWPYQQAAAFYDLRRRELWRPCADCDILGAAQWSADSQSLAFFARRDGEDWPEAALFRVEIARRSLTRLDAHGVVATVAELPDGSTRAAFAWRGRELLLFGQGASRASRRPEWYALGSAQRADALTSALPVVSASVVAIEGCATAMSASDGIWCLDDRRPRRLFGPDIHIANGVAIGWRAASQQVTLEGGTLAGRVLRIGATDRIERVDASPSGRMFVVRTLTRNGTKALILGSPDQTDAIAKVNLHLREVAPAVARPLSHQLPDGGEVTSWLFLPPNALAGERLGLVVIPYPGQSYGGEPPAGLGPATARFNASVQLLAGRGYAVLLPSLPSQPDIPGNAPAFVEGVNLAVDAAVATGTVDPQRIALWGHSYGAYAVAMIATQTCRYATAILSAGIYDLGAIPGIFGPTLRLAPEQGIPIGLQFAWAETGQGGLGVPPWADPERYISASPVYRADRIALPMLIIAADRDVSPMQQAEQLFSALFRQGKDAELVTYWGEGHGIGSPPNVRDLYDRVFTWLDKTLAPPHTGQCEPTALHPDGSPWIGSVTTASYSGRLTCRGNGSCKA